MKIRIKFEKQGPIKFVGHLDMMRYFQKAMRRADVDIKYSEGFNPHQIMSFAAPLGVGLTSLGEYLDIEVETTNSSVEMVNRLNSTMADGVNILSYRKLNDTAKNAMSIVAAADYTISFRQNDEQIDKEQFIDDFICFCNQPEIDIIKKTKRGEKPLNLRPFIYEIKALNKEIFLKLSAGSVNNIKPELVLQAFYDHKKAEYHPFAFAIERKEVYTDLNDTEVEGAHQFVTLESLGEQIE